MSSEIAISVRNLTKTYRLFGHPGDRIKQFFSLGLKQYHREFTALKDVSFDVKKGETVGIIGRNGSGKSTLLQLICGILKPTSGTVTVNGRISALLELGAGFNPEFTGFENVYFQGALQGFTKQQMDERFDAIAAFADIGEFIDQPVRTYSSGMFVRLAFAVAAAVNPDVFVVDEAIAVGDPGFRARCFRRIAELRKGGCTILFVSHAMDQIALLCDVSMLLDSGELLFHGKSKLAIQGFNQLVSVAEADRPVARLRVKKTLAQSIFIPSYEPDLWTIPSRERDDGLDTSKTGNSDTYPPNGAIIEWIGLSALAGTSTTHLHSGERYRCSFRVRFLAVAHCVRFAALIRTRTGIDLGGAWSHADPADGIATVGADDEACVEFEFTCRLHPGPYQIDLAVFASDKQLEYIMHGIIGAVLFNVEVDTVGHAIAYADLDFRSRSCLYENIGSESGPQFDNNGFGGRWNLA